ncbi:hypothetical protein [Enterococcus gallinarum]|uniref:hypothetical protein n=1 Tax=Enterococcus gallinarum TaxID=1353 RepID=UPI00288D78EE|nr:hypothetical protein [Enterococcus gallinarum]MDT2678952.1 hypothetical protein [Enterococcus gallinarum]
MMNTGNEETVVTEVRRESLRLRSRADDEYGGNEETVVTEVRRESLRLRSRADDEYGERRDRSNRSPKGITATVKQSR